MATGQTLDELVVRIKADTKNLNAALGKLKGDLGGVSKTAKGAGAGTGAAFSGMRAKALGVIAAVTGILLIKLKEVTTSQETKILALKLLLVICTKTPGKFTLHTIMFIL